MAMESVLDFLAAARASEGLTRVFTWVGILACLSQAAMFSGLNLALFSVSRLRLEVEAAAGNADARVLLELRRDSNFTLATVLWGNVSVNVLLTLLSDSVLTGVGAFVFSTVVITLFGEITPQAYFSRNALRIGAALAPVLRIYRVLLYPVARITGLGLDKWLGPEAIALFRERDFRALLDQHAEAAGGEVGRVEAAGALNFLDLDDVPVGREGRTLDPRSIIALPVEGGRPVLPPFERSPHDPFLRRIDASGKKWVVFTDPAGVPQLVLDAHHFLRDTLFDATVAGPEAYWHRPITVTDSRTRLGDVIPRLNVATDRPGYDVIDHDLILLWGKQKRIITGADLLGRLLRGIAGTDGAHVAARELPRL
jgi:metal transporter CNNM